MRSAPIPARLRRGAQGPRRQPGEPLRSARGDRPRTAGYRPPARRRPRPGGGVRRAGPAPHGGDRPPAPRGHGARARAAPERGDPAHRDRLAQPGRLPRRRDRARRRRDERGHPAARGPFPVGPPPGGAAERARPAQPALPGAAAGLVALREQRRRGRRLGDQHRGPRSPPGEPARARARDEGGTRLRPSRGGLARGVWWGRWCAWPGTRAASSGWGWSSWSTGATPASGSPPSWTRRPSPTGPERRPRRCRSPCGPSRRRASGRRSCGRARFARRSSSTPPSTASSLPTTRGGSSSSTPPRGGSSATAGPRSSGARWPTPSCPPPCATSSGAGCATSSSPGTTADLGRRREATAMRADGSLVPVEVVVVPAYVKGRVILTAYIRDLSDRRRGERLAAARQRATQALTASLSLAEAAPTVLDALVHGLDCTEAPALGGGGRSSRARPRRDVVGRRARRSSPPRPPTRSPCALSRRRRRRGTGRRRAAPGCPSPSRSGWAARCSGCSR